MDARGYRESGALLDLEMIAMPDLENVVGRWPNVAIEAGTSPEEVMREHNVEPPFREKESGDEIPTFDDDRGRYYE